MRHGNLILRLNWFPRIKIKGFSLIWLSILSLSIWSSLKTLQNHMKQTDLLMMDNVQDKLAANNAIPFSNHTDDESPPSKFQSLENDAISKLIGNVHSNYHSSKKERIMMSKPIGDPESHPNFKSSKNDATKISMPIGDHESHPYYKSSKDDTTKISMPIDDDGPSNFLPSKNDTDDDGDHPNSQPLKSDTMTLTNNDTIPVSKPADDDNPSNFQSSKDASENRNLRNCTDQQPKVRSEVVEEREKAWCGKIAGNAELCKLEGDIRVQAETGTIFFMTSNETSLNSINSWDIKPYPREYVVNLRHWTVKLVRQKDKGHRFYLCTKYHNDPAILFSMFGHSGNYYHSFSDLLFPLYITSFEFQRDVDLLATDYQVSWIPKFHDILSRFTNRRIVDIDKENGQVHCYKKIFVGLKFYKELYIDQSAPEYAMGVSISNFRQLLRETYSLERKNSTLASSVSPRLMIISRKKTRIILNEDEISKAARELGFQVVLAEADGSTNLSKFAQAVNSCDALMGIHGAGLTNMLFLPDKAVLIQLVPLGGIDWWAKLNYGEPPAGMNLRYLEYEIATNESTLGQQYPSDHPVLTHPETFHKAKWELILSLYLDNQNFTIDVERFKGTLVEAMDLLKTS